MLRKNHFTQWPLRIGACLALLAGLLGGTPFIPAQAQTNSGADFGIICENAVLPDPTQVTLHALDGYISIPDGNTVYMWGYGLDLTGTVTYQNPGPTLCFNTGDTVSLTLMNDKGLPEPVSLMFPGQSGAGLQLTPASADSFVQPAAVGGQVTYTFTADHAGTFIYESGTNSQKQVQMGLFGALIVRPKAHPDQVYDWGLTKFNTGLYGSNDYLMLLSEIDPDLHTAVEQGEAFDITAYHPRYWQINGRSFPDTIAPNRAAWLPSQPYGALLHILPSNVSVIPGDQSGDLANRETSKYQQLPSAVRVLNVGMLNHPMHPHGNHVQVVGRDGFPLLGPANEDLSYSKFNIMAGAGQVWDVMYDWTNRDFYNPDTHQVPSYGVGTTGDAFTTGGPQDTIGSTNSPTGGPSDPAGPRNLNLLFKDPNFFSGSPYLGYQANKNDGGAASYNQCGEYYQIWHSHALNEAANYEAGFGGMITLERIDPPGRFNCVAP